MKIISTRSLGVKRVYSPEMAGNQHNYITQNSKAVHKNSHSVSYCLMALRCLWLKAHFAPEWWASVMSGCHRDKLIRYMGVARFEGWKPTEITDLGTFKSDVKVKSVIFDTLNVNNLTSDFTVTGNSVNQGMVGIKGIGETASATFQGISNCSNIDEFIEAKNGKDKIVLERFIKLGAFKNIPGHHNSKALWTYYQYKYCSGKEITALKKEIKAKLLAADGWDEEKIKAEIERQIFEYKAAYPKRLKIPPKITNWKPVVEDDSCMAVLKVLNNEPDFSLSEVLRFEMEYFGYYLHSPLDLYYIGGNSSIDNAKKTKSAKIEAVVTNFEFAVTKKGKQYGRLKISDGVQECLVMIWTNELSIQEAENLVAGAGISLNVDYDDTRNIFTLQRNDKIMDLIPR